MWVFANPGRVDELLKLLTQRTVEGRCDWILIPMQKSVKPSS